MNRERSVVEVAIGIGAGSALAVVGRSTKLDRERSWSGLLLGAIASYWVLFAILDGADILRETTVALSFTLLAILAASTRRLRIVAWAIIAHGAYDALHPVLWSVGPDWWPGFCGGVDLVVGASLLVPRPIDASRSGDDGA